MEDQGKLFFPTTQLVASLLVFGLGEGLPHPLVKVPQPVGGDSATLVHHKFSCYAGGGSFAVRKIPQTLNFRKFERAFS